ncbi:MAG: hypothetical protein E5V28_21135 [Mesorhizobium sp.]|nr:MAG: hypothetical protein EOS59_23250 [Mesorhizobium sp.]RWE55075.1 MAG: hypothetical protein EOS24_24430 [Mesorhizobium sp.]RWF08639.1 MAG: hypothetical protein EOS69_23230 [Mesorhizobium sp.]RWF16090.1 MAG: hypothetical protein EOS25_21350 [Mesorhizobium sp.]TIX56050.1 MAG: hypothetical protein E5V28_21135 [Mesorhizobium sp.]
MGIRAALEIVMIDKVADHGTIGKNVSKFLEAGFVPKASHQLFEETMIEGGRSRRNASQLRAHKRASRSVDGFDRMVDSLDLRSSVCRGQCERKDTSAKKPANMRQG